MTKAQPYTKEDLIRGVAIVQELHGLRGYEAWAEHIAKAIAATRATIQPQRIRETLESARDYIASVNFYAAGTSAYIKNCEQLIKIDAVLALTRPEQRPTEKIEDGQS